MWYQVSPIGPFCELDVLEPVRFGARPGWSVTRSVVSDGRAGWGVAREVGRVQWAEDAGEVSVMWVERGLKMTARRRPGSWPVVVRSRLLQGGGTVPVRLRALAHRARVEIDVEERDDGLGVLAGGHPGVVLSSQRLRVRPALQRAGTIRSLWAAVPPAEPGAAGIGMTSVH